MELELASLDQIIEEISKRYECFVFSGTQNNIGKKGKVLTVRKWGGYSTEAAGLASMLISAIYKIDIDENELEDYKNLI